MAKTEKKSEPVAPAWIELLELLKAQVSGGGTVESRTKLVEKVEKIIASLS